MYIYRNITGKQLTRENPWTKNVASASIELPADLSHEYACDSWSTYRISYFRGKFGEGARGAIGWVTYTERRKVSVSFLGLVHIDPIHPSEFFATHSSDSPRGGSQRSTGGLVPVIDIRRYDISGETRTSHYALGPNRIELMRFSRITGLHVTRHEDTLDCRDLSNVFRSYPSIVESVTDPGSLATRDARVRNDKARIKKVKETLWWAKARMLARVGRREDRRQARREKTEWEKDGEGACGEREKKRGRGREKEKEEKERKNERTAVAPGDFELHCKRGPQSLLSRSLTTYSRLRDFGVCAVGHSPPPSPPFPPPYHCRRRRCRRHHPKPPPWFFSTPTLPACLLRPAAP